MISLEINKVSFSYENNNKVLEDINLSIKPGEFICILGESGCGKSTLLRLIAGLEKPDLGEIKIGESMVTKPMSSTGIVFQEPRLIPWLNVKDNLALRYKMKSEKVQDDKIFDTLEFIGIESYAKLKPNELSGGMAQRVALSRALLGGTNLLLMDEPFGALDALTRLKLQEELLTIWQEKKTTIIFITHEIDEALFFGDRIIIMSSNPGEVDEIIDVKSDRPRTRDSHQYIKELMEVKNKLFKTINQNKHGQTKSN